MDVARRDTRTAAAIRGTTTKDMDCLSVGLTCMGPMSPMVTLSAARDQIWRTTEQKRIDENGKRLEKGRKEEGIKKWKDLPGG